MSQLPDDPIEDGDDDPLPNGKRTRLDLTDTDRATWFFDRERMGDSPFNFSRLRQKPDNITDAHLKLITNYYRDKHDKEAFSSDRYKKVRNSFFECFLKAKMVDARWLRVLDITWRDIEGPEVPNVTKGSIEVLKSDLRDPRNLKGDARAVYSWLVNDLNLTVSLENVASSKDDEYRLIQDPEGNLDLLEVVSILYIDLRPWVTNTELMGLPLLMK